MICVNKETELTRELLQKILHNFFNVVQPGLIKNKNYYDGIQDILKKTYSDPSKPCNRTVINISRNIVDSFNGYISTPGCISYSSKEDIEDVMNILRYNDYQSQDSDLLQDALIYGVANELMYMDSESQVRFRLINPTMSFGIFDDSLTQDLLYFVRIYEKDVWSSDDIHCVDVYDAHFVKHYTMTGKNGNLTLIGEEPHYFGQCPANIFYMPDEKSVFDCILTEQNAINEIVSAEVDEINALVDAYLCLKGVDADEEDIAAMKANRVMLLPLDGDAGYITKNSNDVRVENILKRLQDAAYRIAQCPDFSSETFVGGVASGIALRYRLSGMEFRAGKIEGEMKKALQRRVEIICGMAALKLGEAVFRDIQIHFKRNIPVDEAATINLINGLKGTVSDKTLLSQLDFVEDVDAELEAIQEQKQANMSLYSFGLAEDEE
jgi:SPP1 family phage portal protein